MRKELEELLDTKSKINDDLVAVKRRIKELIDPCKMVGKHVHWREDGVSTFMRVEAVDFDYDDGCSLYGFAVTSRYAYGKPNVMAVHSSYGINVAESDYITLYDNEITQETFKEKLDEAIALFGEISKS